MMKNEGIFKCLQISFVIFWIIYMIGDSIINARPLDTNNLPEEQATDFFQHPTSAQSTYDGNETDPSEIQKAVCTVTAGDVKASAEAVTTKVLKGVCGSAEMSAAFSSLKNKLQQELQDIRKLLIALHQHHGLNVNDYIKQDIAVIPSESPSLISTTTISTIKLQPIPTENNHNENKITHNSDMSPKLKFLPTKDLRNTSTPVREREISMFNNTLLTDKDLKVFTYYWKIENFTSMIKTGNSISVESPIFSIKGKSFKIKAYFQHLHRDFLFLQLEDYSSSTSKLSFGNSIILDTGGLFKQIDSNNFKYKISILDQNKKRSKDLVSQEFHNHEKGFSIPNSALMDSSFIKDHALIVQIFLYL